MDTIYWNTLSITSLFGKQFRARDNIFKKKMPAFKLLNMLIVYCKLSLTLKYTQPSILHGNLCWSDPIVGFSYGRRAAETFYVKTYNFQTFTHSVLCTSKSSLRVATNETFLCYESQKLAEFGCPDA